MPFCELKKLLPRLAKTLIKFALPGTSRHLAPFSSLTQHFGHTKGIYPAKQDGIVYRIPCDCGKVYRGETKDAGEDQRTRQGIHDSSIPIPPPFPNMPMRPVTIRFGTRTSLLIEILTGTHVRSRKLSTKDFTNRDSGIEIPEVWMPTIKKHNNRKTVQQRTAEGTATPQNNGTIGGSKCTNHSRP